MAGASIAYGNSEPKAGLTVRLTASTPAASPLASAWRRVAACVAARRASAAPAGHRSGSCSASGATSSRVSAGISWPASSTVTSTPRSASAEAAATPAGPEPTTMTASAVGKVQDLDEQREREGLERRHDQQQPEHAGVVDLVEHEAVAGPAHDQHRFDGRAGDAQRDRGERAAVEGHDGAQSLRHPPADVVAGAREHAELHG